MDNNDGPTTRSKTKNTNNSNIPKNLCHSNSTIIYQKQGKNYIKDTIIDNLDGKYIIQYNDSDIGELTHSEVSILRTKPPSQTSTSPNRHKRIEQEYLGSQYIRTLDKEVRRSPRQHQSSNFSKGFANASMKLRPTWYEPTKIKEPPLEALCNAIIDDETGARLEYHQLIKHPKYKDIYAGKGGSAINELGRLMQGIGSDRKGGQRVKGTNTIFVTRKHKIPPGKKATYARIVADYRPEKKEKHRTRITAGGDRLTYEGDVSTQTTDLTTANILLNSVVLTPSVKFMAIDLKNMYLQTILRDFQYMQIPLHLIPDEVIEEYNLNEQVKADGYVYFELRRAIYGLKESGKLTNIDLENVLATGGYRPYRFTPGLYKHDYRPILFCLTTDDFGTKYTRKEDVEHLLTTLRTKYEVTTNWEGTFYLGLTLKWDYNKVHTMRSVIKSMSGSVKTALLRFGHIARRIMHAASPYTAPTYGKHQQLAPTIDPTTFTLAQRKRLEEILGVFLYYGRAIDNTMLHALNDMASQIATGNKKTDEAIECFLDYAATHPETEIKYVASDMVLQAESDTAYLVAPKARSRAGGYIYLGSKNREKAIINGPVLVIAKILKMVVSSAAKGSSRTFPKCTGNGAPTNGL